MSKAEKFIQEHTKGCSNVVAYSGMIEGNELCGWEYTIPEGMEATIVDNKIVVKKKESEDEQHRKWILEYLYDGLRKSDEQFFDQFKSAIAWFENQGEQKPAWSEEDERIRQDIENLIHFALRDGSAVSPAADTTKEDAISWIQSLKDRVQPQNLNVTDEELIKARNEAYNDALDKLEYHSDTPTFNDGWSAAIWYLKKRNIQPQNTWKPSDEQMHYLSWIANIKLGDSVVEQEVSKHLNELYKQLKQL